MKRFATLTIGLAVSGTSLPAPAQDAAAAETLFNKGVSEMQAAHYDVACPALAESQRLDPRPGTLFTLAECEAKSGKIATALVHYEDYLRLAAVLPAAQKKRHAQRVHLAEAQQVVLKPQVPTLTLTVSRAAPSDLRVSRDGTALSSASLGIALPVDPGEHIVVTSVGDGPKTEQRIVIAKGEKKVAELRWAGAATTGSSTSPVATGPGGDSGASGRRIGAYVVGGLGVAGLALGGVMGGLALSSKSEVDSHCPKLVCDEQGTKALDQGRTTSLVSTVGLAVGGAGLVTAVILWLTEPSPKVAGQSREVGGKGLPRLGVSAGAGPSGVTLHLKGAF